MITVYVKYVDLQRRNRMHSSRGAIPDLDQLFVGESAQMRELKTEFRAIAAVDAPVLIYGETGTGKEVVAQALHEFSPRGKNEFVAVHCAAINEGIFEIPGNKH